MYCTATDCQSCPNRQSCFEATATRRRILASSCYPAFFRGHSRIGNEEYLAMMRLQKIWTEGSFAVLKREHCLYHLRKRGIPGVDEECLLSAMALNLKRMVAVIFFVFSMCHCSNVFTHLCFCGILSTGPILDSADMPPMKSFKELFQQKWKLLFLRK